MADRGRGGSIARTWVRAALFGGFDGEAAPFGDFVAAFGGFNDAALAVEPLDGGDVELAGLFDEPFGAVAFGDGGGEGEVGAGRGVAGEGLEGGGDERFGDAGEGGVGPRTLAVEEENGLRGEESQDVAEVVGLVFGEGEVSVGGVLGEVRHVKAIEVHGRIIRRRGKVGMEEIGGERKWRFPKRRRADNMDALYSGNGEVGIR